MCYSIFLTSSSLPSPRSSNSFLLAPSTEVYQVHYSSYTFEERCFLSISIPENLNSMSCRQTKHNAIAECSSDSRLRERSRGHRVSLRSSAFSASLWNTSYRLSNSCQNVASVQTAPSQDLQFKVSLCYQRVHEVERTRFFPRHAHLSSEFLLRD